MAFTLLTRDSVRLAKTPDDRRPSLCHRSETPANQLRFDTGGIGARGGLKPDLARSN